MTLFILNSVGNVFFDISSGVIKTMTIDFWFPKRPKTTEEQLRDAQFVIRRLSFHNCGLQDQLLSKDADNQELRREISKLKDLLVEKDKQIKFLSDAKKSLEFRLNQMGHKLKKR